MTAQILEATPALDQSGNISWTLCNKVANQCSGKGDFPKISLPATSGSAPFTITINDANHLGVIFANDATDPFAAKDANGAIWMQTGTACPQQAVWDTFSQVTKATRASDTKITFVDLNSNHGEIYLAYQLNFTRNGKAVTPLDPIIDNGGCCIHNPGFLPTSTAAFALDLALAFVVGVIVTLLARRFLMPGR